MEESPVQTDGSSKLYKLNATSNRTGLEFVIKVMAGDKIDIFGKSYYLNTTTMNNANSTALDVLSLMTSALAGPGNVLGGKGITASQLNGLNSGLLPASFIRGANGESTTVPKAYINYIFLDEQFRYAGGGASRVGSSGSVKSHWSVDATLQNIAAPKNGYIFVYVSNESNVDVFFDNLQVIHKPGMVLEETHYYPWGLTMAGISSKALNNTPQNRYKFNDGTELSNNEFSDGSGLDLYETPFRMYDPQIGRFFQVDGMSDDFVSWTPYGFGFDNPIFFNDPSGLASEPIPKETSTADKPKELAPVVVNGSRKNLQGYSYWSAFVDANKHQDKEALITHLQAEGVNNKGMKLFNEAWSGITYREKLAEIESGWRDFVKDALIEGASWAAGGLVMKVGGKVIALGYREFKVYQKLKAAGKGSSEFFRAMSNAEYAALEANGGLTSKAGKELFVSTAESYSKSYLSRAEYDVLVKFEVNSGTLNALSNIGVRDGSALVRKAGFGNLPKVASGWMEKGFNYFKGEGSVLNVGLGHNPSVFNSNIISFTVIP